MQLGTLFSSSVQFRLSAGSLCYHHFKSEICAFKEELELQVKQAASVGIVFKQALMFS